MAFERADVLPRAEIMLLVTQSYDLVFAKLPKKMQVEIKVGMMIKPAPMT